MKRKQFESHNTPSTPKFVPLDETSVKQFHRNIEEGSHAAFEYVTSPNKGTGWFERGVIEEITTRDGIDRITLRCLTGNDESVEEQHYTIYLDEDGDYDEHITVYDREPSRDLQPVLGSEYPAPDDRFFPEDLPGCSEIGILVGAGIMTEYRFHEPKPTEEYWSVPDRLTVYTVMEDSTELSMGIVNRTGTEQSASIHVDFPDWVEWEHQRSEGRGEFTHETSIEHERQEPVEMQLRCDALADVPDEPVQVPVTLTLGTFEERFEHTLIPRS